MKTSKGDRIPITVSPMDSYTTLLDRAREIGEIADGTLICDDGKEEEDDSISVITGANGGVVGASLTNDSRLLLVDGTIRLLTHFVQGRDHKVLAYSGEDARARKLSNQFKKQESVTLTEVTVVGIGTKKHRFTDNDGNITMALVASFIETINGLSRLKE